MEDQYLGLLMSNISSASSLTSGSDQSSEERNVLLDSSISLDFLESIESMISDETENDSQHSCFSGSAASDHPIMNDQILQVKDKNLDPEVEVQNAPTREDGSHSKK